MTEKETDEVFYYEKNKAKWLSINFSLQKENIIFPTHCPIFKIKLDYRIDTFTNQNHPRLVRKDNTNDKPFSPENTWIISRKAYELLRKLTPQEIKLLGKAINNYY